MSENILGTVIVSIQKVMEEESGILMQCDANTELFRSSLLSSLQIVRLILDLEERFDVTFKDAELELDKIASPQKIAVIVEQALSSRFGRSGR